MSKLHCACLSLLLSIPALTCAEQPASQAEPAALPRPLPAHSGPVSNANEGLIHLDVVVTHKSGKPATGLEAKDFILLDNGQPGKIVSLHAFDPTSTQPDPPSEVIVVIDTLNLPDRLASYEKNEVERFLRQHDGHLVQPVSLFWLSDSGLWTLAQPSADGNVLAGQMAGNKRLALSRRTLRSQTGASLNSLTFEDPPGLSALKALSQIATYENKKPGRKLLLWVGPGWGVGSGKQFFGNLDREQLFDLIGWFSTVMRESRLVLYSFSVGEVDRFSLTMDAPITPRAALFEAYLKGVKSDRRASIENLDRKVLAVQSGGRVLAPVDDLRTDILHTGLTDRTPAFDLVSQIDSCVEEASAFYTLTFNPADTEQTDEYHDLAVQASRPELTARTNTGYYDEPYFYDQPHRAATQVTVEQLERVLTADRSDRDSDVARQLSEVELSERLSDAELSSLEVHVPGSKGNAALGALAAASEFLDPPAAEIPANAPPDPNEQQRMIALAVDYLGKTKPKLPNFFATRITARYEETPEHYDETGRKRINYEPVHWVQTSKATVLYRQGNEIVEPEGKKPKSRQAEDEGLITEGTFGPILGAVSDANAVPSGLTWSHWEHGEGGQRAIFRYVIPQNRSRFRVGFCCLPEGDGTTRVENLTGYHGEIAIDPVSGTILRLTLEADLQPNLPLSRSGIVVEYGPVEIGGKTYICPVKSVSVSRARTIRTFTGFSDSFRMYGPYSTMLNDVSFRDYHIFRTETRVLTGDEPAPDK